MHPAAGGPSPMHPAAGGPHPVYPAAGGSHPVHPAAGGTSSRAPCCWEDLTLCTLLLGQGEVSPHAPWAQRPLSPTIPPSRLRSLSGPLDSFPHLENEHDNDSVYLTGCCED